MANGPTRGHDLARAPELEVARSPITLDGPVAEKVAASMKRLQGGAQSSVGVTPEEPAKAAGQDQGVAAIGQSVAMTAGSKIGVAGSEVTEKGVGNGGDKSLEFAMHKRTSFIADTGVTPELLGIQFSKILSRDSTRAMNHVAAIVDVPTMPENGFVPMEVAAQQSQKSAGIAVG